MILPMPVVSNTSPIWNLASIERLDLFHEQFSDVRIPHDVWQELQVGHEYPEVVRIQRAIDAKWITVESLSNPYLQQSLMLEITTKKGHPFCLCGASSCQLPVGCIRHFPVSGCAIAQLRIEYGKSHVGYGEPACRFPPTPCLPVLAARQGRYRQASLRTRQAGNEPPYCSVDPNELCSN